MPWPSFSHSATDEESGLLMASKTGSDDSDTSRTEDEGSSGSDQSPPIRGETTAEIDDATTTTRRQPSIWDSTPSDVESPPERAASSSNREEQRNSTTEPMKRMRSSGKNRPFNNGYSSIPSNAEAYDNVTKQQELMFRAHLLSSTPQDVMIDCESQSAPSEASATKEDNNSNNNSQQPSKTIPMTRQIRRWARGRSEEVVLSIKRRFSRSPQRRLVPRSQQEQQQQQSKYANEKRKEKKKEKEFNDAGSHLVGHSQRGRSGSMTHAPRTFFSRSPQRRLSRVSELQALSPLREDAAVVASNHAKGEEVSSTTPRGRAGDDNLQKRVFSRSPQRRLRLFSKSPERKQHTRSKSEPIVPLDVIQQQEQQQNVMMGAKNEDEDDNSAEGVSVFYSTLVDSTRGFDLEDDEESDGGWSDTDDDSLDDEDPLDVLEGKPPRDENEIDPDQDVLSVKRSRSISRERNYSLRNPYSMTPSSSMVGLDNASVADSEYMDSPSVRALWSAAADDDNNTALVSQSTLQLRGTAEQEGLRQELQNALQVQEFWVTVEPKDSGDYSDDDDDSLGVEGGGGFFHAESVDDVILANTAEHEDTIAHPTNEDLHQSFGSDATDRDYENCRNYTAALSDYVIKTPVNIRIDCDDVTAVLSSKPDDDDSVKTDTCPSSDDYDEEALFIGIFKKLEEQEIEKKHWYMASAMVGLGIIFLLVSRLWWWKHETETASTNIYRIDPTDLSSIPKIDVDWTLEEHSIAYHVHREAPVQVTLQVPASSEVYGLSNKYIEVKESCPEGEGMFLHDASNKSSALNIVLLGEDSSLILCHGGTVQSVSYHVFGKPNIMSKSNFTATLDMTENSRINILTVGPVEKMTGPGTIMLIPASPKVQFFTDSSQQTQPLRAGSECNTDTLPEARWLPMDSSTMLPSVAWWHVPDMKAQDSPIYVYACENGTITSTGATQYSQSKSYSPTSAPKVAPTTPPTMYLSPSEAPTEGPTAPTANPTIAAPAITASIEGSWKNVGDDIPGPGLGAAISLSENGRVLALGSPPTANDDKSSVIIYKWVEGNWTEHGKRLLGKESDDGFGNAVAVSGNGNVVIVGAPRHGEGIGQARIFHYEDGAWKQRGSALNGFRKDDYFGVSVDITSDGLTVAVGAYGVSRPAEKNSEKSMSSVGHVRVYTYDEDAKDWVQIGPEILGLGENDRFGYYVSVAKTGQDQIIVAAGARGVDGKDNAAGHVRVYTTDGDEWAPMGEPLETESYTTGISRLSLSGDGNRIVTGSSWAVEKRGRASVYEFDSDKNTWKRLGSPIQGSQAGDWLGVSVDISADGTTIAAGAMLSDADSKPNAGQVGVYRYNDDIGGWAYLDAPLEGVAKDDNWGRSVALSRNGNRLAGGAYLFQPSNDNIGRVRVMDWNENED